ncbi:MAG: FAD-dependent oxidoreductase, partial [Verrucomicrobiota bacterium]
GYVGDDGKGVAAVDRRNGYPLPYRWFYSQNIGNLFMAGRHISVTHEALGTVRVMRTIGMMGEVVGKAAYLAVRENTDPRGVYQKLLPDLIKLMEQPGRMRRSDLRSDLFLVMHFEERLHAEFEDEFMEPLQARGIQNAGHEQDRIGPEGSRLTDLVFTHHEVLAEQRLGNKASDFLEALHTPAEVAIICKDRERPDTGTLLVGVRGLGNVFRAHGPHTRGARLDLRNQAKPFV